MELEIFRPLRGLGRQVGCDPRLGYASPGAITLSASFAGSVNGLSIGKALLSQREQPQLAVHYLPSNLSLRFINQPIIFLVGNLLDPGCYSRLSRWITMRAIDWVSLSAQMREHVVATSDLALMSQR